MSSYSNGASHNSSCSADQRTHVPQSNRHTTKTPFQTVPNVELSYGNPPPQPSAANAHVEGEYPSDTVPPIPRSINSPHDTHCGPYPHNPHLTNARNHRPQLQRLHNQQASPTIKESAVAPELHVHLSGQREPNFRQHGGSIAPNVHSLVPQSYLPREPHAKVVHNEDYHSGSSSECAIGTRQVPNEASATCSPINQSSRSAVPMTKRHDGASESAKRLQNNQRELSNHSSKYNESDRHRQVSLTKETFLQRNSELVPLRGNPRSNLPGATSECARGFFSNSSNVAISQSTMIEIVHAQAEEQLDRVLHWLTPYIMKDTGLHSRARYPPPRCQPNTRIPTIKRMENWIKDPCREKKRGCWVYSAAGAGRSAVIQTVFESLPEERRGGSVFFRPSGPDILNQVFPTIAYQLAVRFPSYKAYLERLRTKDPQSLDVSMEQQFCTLFEEPFAKQKLLDGRDALVIALDDLDKCGIEPTDSGVNLPFSRDRFSESVQQEIVELISHFIQQHPSVPLLWIIASRPEKHLQVTFAVESIFGEEEILVDSEEACQDVKTYLENEFARIRKNHDDSITDSPWPNSEDLSVITTKASGLFIFARTVIHLIDGYNPVENLKDVLAAISKTSLPKVARRPLPLLDKMYEEIVSKVPHELQEDARKIVGTIAQLDHKGVSEHVCTLPTICNILNIPKDVALSALRHLRSVLYFPKEIALARPRFYHTSFRDFLEDKSRSHKYSIEEVKVGDYLANGLMEFAKRVSLTDDSLPWPRDGDSQRIMDMAKKEYNPSDLLSFRVHFFSSVFTVSENVVSKLLRAHDFAANHSHVLPMVLMKDETIQKHERLGVVCRKRISSLGITRDTVSKSKISEEQLGRYVVYLSEDSSPCKEKKEVTAIRNILCRWVEAEAGRLVTVWGCEPSKRSAVFRLSYDPATIRFFGRSICYRRHRLDVPPDIVVIGV